MPTEFRILGPLEVAEGDRPVALGGQKQRALLTVLLLNANEVVSTDRLIDEVWAGEPPATAKRVVQVYVSQLRKALGSDGSANGVLETRGPGYLLHIEPGQRDLDRFEELFAAGRSALAEGDAKAAEAKLEEALAVWRGSPLADFAYESFAQAEIARLEERRLACVEEWVDAELALGRHEDLVGELEALVARYPLRERLRGQLMLALYRAGRQAEALACFDAARRALADELGIEPGHALKELERRILNQDPVLAAPPRVERERALALLPALVRRRPRLLVALGALLLAGAVAAVVVQLTTGGSATKPAALAGDAVALVDAGTGSVDAAVELPARPGDVAVGAGAVWVTIPDDGRVVRIDPESRSIVDAIPVGISADGIAVGGGAVWVADAGGPSLARISPETNTVVQRIAVGNGPVDVAVGGGAVWVANRLDGTVQRIDPVRGAVTDTIHVGDEPTAVVVAGGGVWVADVSRGSVYRIDARTREATQTVPVGNGPSSVAVADASVWVANGLDGTVSRIDGRRGAVTATLRVGDGPVAVASGEGAVWAVSEVGGTLVRIEPATAAVDRVVRLGGSPQSVAFANGAIWVSARSAAAGHRGGTLRAVASSATDLIDPAYLIDPALAYDPLAWQILTMTNDGLIDYKRVGGVNGVTLIPNLALHVPTPSDGGRTYAFQLRSGLRYSSGEAVRASDFRRAFERGFGANGSQFGFRFASLVGAGACIRATERCDLSAGIAADDRAGTVTFHLTEPDPEFLYELAMPFTYPVPAGVPDRDVGTNPVSATGPYVIEEFDPGKRITLVRNPGFREWSREAQPDGFADRIELSVASSPGAGLTAVERGQADVVAGWGAIPGDRLGEVTTTYAGQAHTFSQAGSWFLVLNTRAAPFDDERVRRALNYAIDRAAIVDLFGGPGYARPTCQVLPPNFPGYQPYCPYTEDPGPSGEWRAPDVERAQSLVRASGTLGSRVTVWTSPDLGAFAVPVGREVVSLLDRLGYRASLRTIAAGETYFDTLRDLANGVQVALSGWVQDYPAASEYLASQLSCDVLFPEDPERNGNFAAFCDPAIDATIERGLELELTDPSRAGDVWAEVDHAIVDKAPYVPLVNPIGIQVVSKRVGNFQSHPQWGVLLDQLWVR